MKYFQFFIRLFCSFITLGVLAYFTPDFSKANLPIFFILSFALCSFDFFIGTFTRLQYYPMLKAIIGFALCIVALYLLQFLSVGYILSFTSILIGACVFGLAHICFDHNLTTI